MRRSGPHLHIPPLFPGCDPMDVRVDFSSHTSTNTREYVDRNGNDGMRDIGPPGNGNRVLLVRGLNSQTSQEEVRDRLSAEIVRLAETMPSSDRGKVVDGRQAIKRVVIIRHRNTKTSIRIGGCFAGAFAFPSRSACRGGRQWETGRLLFCQSRSFCPRARRRGSSSSFHQLAGQG
jgi:hypothetical protein